MKFKLIQNMIMYKTVNAIEILSLVIFSNKIFLHKINASKKSNLSKVYIKKEKKWKRNRSNKKKRLKVCKDASGFAKNMIHFF